MASCQYSQSPLPPYSRRPTTNEQVLRVAPDFPLAVEAIQVVQDWFPGTSAGDAWEFVQQLAFLVRADVRVRQSERANANRHATSEQPTREDPQTVVPEDSPMPDAA